MNHIPAGPGGPFDFTVDQSTNSVLITKVFEAGLSMVWDAFTQPELLDQWWAPKPLVSITKRMNFEEGGIRHYSMVWPDGQEHWGLKVYTFIHPQTKIKWLSSFSDKDANINKELPASDWELNFSEEKGPDGNQRTTLNIVIKHKTLADLEMVIKMGFKEGFSMTLNELDTLLPTFNK